LDNVRENISLLCSPLLKETPQSSRTSTQRRSPMPHENGPFLRPGFRHGSIPSYPFPEATKRDAAGTPRGFPSGLPERTVLKFAFFSKTSFRSPYVQSSQTLRDFALISGKFSPRPPSPARRAFSFFGSGLYPAGHAFPPPLRPESPFVCSYANISAPLPSFLRVVPFCASSKVLPAGAQEFFPASSARRDRIQQSFS